MAWPSMGGGSTPDPFEEAVRTLGLTVDHFERAVANFEKMTQAAQAAFASAGGPGGGGKGGRAATPDRGFLGRAFEMSRFSKDYERNAGPTRYLLGGSKGGAGGAAGGVAKAAGVVGVILGAAQALNEMRKAVEQMTTAAVESKRKLADAGSGAMANVFAKRDVRELLRDQKVGDALAPATGRLADAEQRRKDATAPFTIAFEKAEARVLEFFNDKLTDVLEFFRKATNEIIRVLTAGAEREFFPAVAGPAVGPLDAALGALAAPPAGRLADIAAAAVGRVKMGGAAPAGAAGPFRLS